MVAQLREKARMALVAAIIGVCNDLDGPIAALWVEGDSYSGYLVRGDGQCIGIGAYQALSAETMEVGKLEDLDATELACILDRFELPANHQFDHISDAAKAWAMDAPCRSTTVKN